MLEFGNQNPVIITPAPEARQEYIVRVLNAAVGGGGQEADVQLGGCVQAWFDFSSEPVCQS